MGQPTAAFPTQVREAHSRATEKPLEGRPGETPAAGRLRRSRPRSSTASIGHEPTRPRRRLVPAVSEGVRGLRRPPAQYSDTSVLPTPVFFYGMAAGEEIAVDIEPGKTLIIKFLTVGDPHADGTPHRVLRAQRPAARRHRGRSLAATSDRGGRQGRSGRPAPDRSPPCPAWSSRSPFRRATRSPRARSCSCSKR